MQKMKQSLLVLTLSIICNWTHAFVEEQITFHNGPVALSGTLLMPSREGKHPAIVFLHGSGPTTRESARPLADFFVKNGVASLVFDKRGCGLSGGSWTAASLKDLASDAVAAVQFIKKKERIDPNKIGLWGHSQAGWVAPISAGMTRDIGFLIVVAGGGETPYVTEMYAYHTAMDRAGLSHSEKDAANELLNQYFDYLRTGKGRDLLVKAISTARKNRWYSVLPLDRILPTEDNLPNWNWVAHYDPASDIAKLKIRVLLIFGGKDPVTSPTAAAKWEQALKTAGNRHFTIQIFPEAGHAMTVGEHHDPGHASGYVEGYLETMITWLKKNVMSEK